MSPQLKRFYIHKLLYGYAHIHVKILPYIALFLLAFAAAVSNVETELAIIVFMWFVNSGSKIK